VPIFEEAGWLIRHDLQFHWENRDYKDFADFLGALSSMKRKNLRKERIAAQEGVEIRQLTGDQIRPEHWDAFWHFYQDTGSRKWGRPYLTREAFTLLGETMADKILLVLAFIDDQPVAGALNFIGGDCLYGRYWGRDRQALPAFRAVLLSGHRCGHRAGPLPRGGWGAGRAQAGARL
jgi:predicted N-acyltransferase